ncbi:MAG: tetratricopeptide repeat protein [Candidatus Latescibacterota bacterium]|nr:MAG: tetratricopeptide repeat protein [Candidatus Latescibacterota bacterium]
MSSWLRSVGLLPVCGMLLLSVSVAVAGSDRPVGLIIMVEGGVSVAHGGELKEAVEGLVLEPGDTLVVKIGGRCTGFGVDGKSFDVKGPAELVMSLPSPEGKIDKVLAFISRQLSQWSGASRSRSLVARSARDWELVSSVPAPVIPANNGTVRAGETRFVWTTVQGIDRYIMTIAPEEGDEIKQTIRGHMFTRDDLQPGAKYVWKVQAQGAGSPAGSQWNSFYVLTAEEEKQIDDSLAGLGKLEAGVLLLSLGLTREAINLFDAAVVSEPDNRSALRWRAEALAAVGLYKDAYDDLVKTLGR